MARRRVPRLVCTPAARPHPTPTGVTHPLPPPQVLQAEVNYSPNHTDAVAARSLRHAKRYRVPESPLLQARAHAGGWPGRGCVVPPRLVTTPRLQLLGSCLRVAPRRCS